MALLLSICVGISVVPVMAYADDGVVRQGESTNAKYFKFEKSSKKGEVKVVDYIGTESTVVVPKMYKGKKVTEVDFYWYSDKSEKAYKGIRTLIIPEGVKTVYFPHGRLKKISLPNSAKTIEEDGRKIGFVVDCKCGSYAEKWALSHDIPLACGTNTKVIKKASFESTYRTGKVQNSCSKCGVTQTAKIPYADAECIIEGTLGWCGVFYNGKTRNAHIEVMQILDSDYHLLTEGEDFTVKVPSGRKNVGVYYYVVTLKGKYEGTKKLPLIIAPKKTKFTKIKRGKNSITVKWKKQTSQTDGYQIKYKSRKMKKYKVITIKGNKKTSVKLKKLKRKTQYEVTLRTYKTVKGKKIGKWSSKLIKTK